MPKTVDNDLPHTDCCPGFGSVAKYVAVSTREAALDVASMARTSTKVFVLEVMGRHAGWIAAAGGLAGEKPGDPPHVILFPEIPFEQKEFLAKVKAERRRLRLLRGRRLRRRAPPRTGSFSRMRARRTRSATRSSAASPRSSRSWSRPKLGYKYHWAVADYLQRSARHIASKVDVEQAYAVGKAAVELAVKGVNAVMPTIVRKSDKPYRWTIGQVPLAEVANQEKKVPRDYITADGFGITAACRRYLATADPRRGLSAVQGRTAGLTSGSRGRVERKLRPSLMSKCSALLRRGRRSWRREQWNKARISRRADALA